MKNSISVKDLYVAKSMPLLQSRFRVLPPNLQSCRDATMSLQIAEFYYVEAEKKLKDGDEERAFLLYQQCLVILAQLGHIVIPMFETLDLKCKRLNISESTRMTTWLTYLK